MNELHYVNFVAFLTTSSQKYQNVSLHQIVRNGRGQVVMVLDSGL